MSNEKWKDLEKYACGNHHKLEEIIKRGSCPSTRVNFAHMAFSEDEETLITVDSKGIVYYVELAYETPSYRKLGHIGTCTFIAFNPVNKNEFLVGHYSSDVKILRLDSLRNFCLLVGHSTLPTNISFYKHYCLTSSSKEAIIWDLRCYCKVHQLRLNIDRVTLKKASFSSQGLISVLYPNDVIQAWKFQHFDNEFKVNTKSFGLQHVKDFVFTNDGRAIIIVGVQNKILIFNTHDWTILKNINLKDEITGAKQIEIVPQPLDGGANRMITILSSDCNCKFFDLTTSSFIKNCCGIFHGIKRFRVSNGGKFLAHIDQDGILFLTNLERIVNVKRKEKEKKGNELKESGKLRAHLATDHLQCIKESIREELKLERLLPILKEFGEYPEKHRMLIWSTILQLPGNRQSYASLGNNIPASVIEVLLQDYPLADKSKASCLTLTLEKVLEWCPIFSNCSILPGFIFPFTVVFQKDPVLAFEAILTILLNFCQKWFEYHPLPPLNILGIIENILLEADPGLLNIFCKRKITSTEYAWPLLRTTMSEVLAADEWLILWDNLLSFRQQSLLLMCTIAYSICARETIISSVKSPEEIERFYTTPGHVRVKDLLKATHRLNQQISHRSHPNRYLRKKIITLSPKVSYPQYPQEEYPKILAHTETVRQEEDDRIYDQCRIEAMQSIEEERLRSEVKKFNKKVHQARLKEAEKCLKKQVRNSPWKLEKSGENYQRDLKLNKIESQVTEKIMKCRSEANVYNNREKCNKLRCQVQRLDCEIHNLLGAYRSKNSRNLCKNSEGKFNRNF